MKTNANHICHSRGTEAEKFTLFFAFELSGKLSKVQPSLEMALHNYFCFTVALLATCSLPVFILINIKNESIVTWWTVEQHELLGKARKMIRQ